MVHDIARAFRCALPLALACIALSAIGAQPAHARPLTRCTGTTVMLSTPTSPRLVADVRGSSTRNGARVIVWDDLAGENQSWCANQEGPFKWFSLQAWHSGKCLDETQSHTWSNGPVTAT